MERYTPIPTHNVEMARVDDGEYVLFSEAQAEIEALKESKIPDLVLEELHYVDGKIDMIGSHPIFSILMAEASRMFDLHGATNFLSFAGIDKQDRHFAITIQLRGGKTPSEKLTEQQAEIARLNGDLKLNASMLAKQTDLAREAETERDRLREALNSIANDDMAICDSCDAYQETARAALGGGS